jgi:hypothetical protein
MPKPLSVFGLVLVARACCGVERQDQPLAAPRHIVVAHENFRSDRVWLVNDRHGSRDWRLCEQSPNVRAPPLSGCTEPCHPAERDQASSGGQWFTRSRRMVIGAVHLRDGKVSICSRTRGYH